MRTHTFQTFARGAAGELSRRTSLLALGSAALAAGVTNASVTTAKKKKNCKKKQNQRCNNDAAACLAQIPVVCEGDPDCTATLTLCCEECSANGLLTCLLAAQNMTATARLK